VTKMLAHLHHQEHRMRTDVISLSIAVKKALSRSNQSTIWRHFGALQLSSKDGKTESRQ